MIVPAEVCCLYMMLYDLMSEKMEENAELMLFILNAFE